MASKTLRALAFAAPLAACTAFDGEPGKDGGTDGPTTTTGLDGGPGDGGVEAEGGGGGPDGAAACVTAPPFDDRFERINPVSAEWQPTTGAGGTLAIETVGPLEASRSLKVEFQPGTKGNAYLARALSEKACAVDVAFLFKPMILGATADVQLVQLELASTEVALVLVTGGKIVVRERENGTVVPDKYVGAVSLGAPFRVGLRLDLEKPELVAALGPDGSLPATQTFTPVYAHAKPKTLRFGGVAADSNVQFHYLLDRFELR